MLLPTDPHEDWLQMPFEQGGRRFGPLPDRVRIGSDPACDVVLGAALGVPPVAIELRRNERRAWTVEYASQPPWPCEIVRAHGPDEAAGPGRPVRSGGRFAPGETLALSAIGATPQFTLLRTGPFGPDPLADEEQPRDEVDVRITRRLAAAKVIVEDLDDPRAPDEVGASPRGAGGDLAGAVASEAMRQARSRVLARSGAARELDRVSRLTRQGAWTSPYMLVGAALALVTMICGGAATWAAWAGRLWGGG